MKSYVVVDLEMCKVPKANRTKLYHWGSETIQIGAVLLDENYDVVDRFMTYVAPQFGEIDSYIHKLTGISNEDVADAPIMKDALELFVKWVPDGATVVSWSDTDKVQIEHELQGKEFVVDNIDSILENWVDCQVTFTEKLNNGKVYRLSEALIIANINYDDGQHDGLIDAYNEALLFKKMMTEEKFELSEYYKSVEEDTNLVYNPFGALFDGLAF